MARAPQCDQCRRVADGSARGKIGSYQVSVGYALYETDLCNGHPGACYYHVPLSRIPEIGRRIGAGHLKGVDQLDSLPVVLPQKGDGPPE